MIDPLGHLPLERRPHVPEGGGGSWLNKYGLELVLYEVP